MSPISFPHRLAQPCRSRRAGTAPEVAVRLAGNPNVGKSTVFNVLTGLHQHTGNWAGKTVQNAEGVCRFRGRRLRIMDIPGAYSLLARSQEEAVARDCICFSKADVTVVVCDATALHRNMNLVLQTLEVTPRVVVCVNLLDEAARRGISLDLPLLSSRLGVPVVGTSARKKEGVGLLREAVLTLAEAERAGCAQAGPFLVEYDPLVEKAAAHLADILEPLLEERLSARWTALKLMENDPSLLSSLDAFLGFSLLDDPAVSAAREQALLSLRQGGLDPERLPDALVAGIFRATQALLSGVICQNSLPRSSRQLHIDRLLTGRLLGLPLMLLLLALVFYLTIAGANVPSAWLSGLFIQGERFLRNVLTGLHTPPLLSGLLIDGMFRTLGWVVAVMLPPMAIFFPLFTLLEDLGYLPRVAFNLDRRFRRCGGCGKQALTMWVVDNGMRDKGERRPGRGGGDCQKDLGLSRDRSSLTIIPAWRLCRRNGSPQVGVSLCVLTAVPLAAQSKSGCLVEKRSVSTTCATQGGRRWKRRDLWGVHLVSHLMKDWLLFLYIDNMMFYAAVFFRGKYKLRSRIGHQFTYGATVMRLSTITPMKAKDASTSGNSTKRGRPRSSSPIFANDMINPARCR